ncbi:unnamed protein product [Orchesella dallaii]|uniref:Uncharacterized protein n=1 Tax=Orchesella dallaii TaxID=48710 RepID=A0ABP1R3D6_9HEXA
MSSVIEDSSHPDAKPKRGGDTHHDGSGDVACALSMPHRSSRANFGTLPNRCGEWSTPPRHPRSQHAMPPPLLRSTVIAAYGRQLTRTSFATSGEDDASSLSSCTSQASFRPAARSSRLEQNQEEIQRLQLESQQLEASMKQRIIRVQNKMPLLNQENSILEKQQQLGYEVEAALPFGTDSGKPVNKDVQMRTYLLAILPDKRFQRFLQTPRRPTVPPPHTSTFSAIRKEEIDSWLRRQQVFGARRPITDLLGHGGKDVSTQPVPPSSNAVLPEVSGEKP